MTPQELLNQSRRVQANTSIPTPAIAPKAFQAGQYRVAVQQAPSASQTMMGKLSSALGQLNPAIEAYGQAKQAETDLQKKVVSLDIQQMSEAEKESFAAQLQTEEKINKRFRGENYALNPLAKVYAKDFLGASKAGEFNMQLQTRKEEYINQQLSVGNNLSANEVEQFMASQEAEFLAENSDFFGQDAILMGGFKKGTAKLRNEQTQKIFFEANERHKNEVLIPEISKNLGEALRSGDTETATNIWARTSIFTPAEQTTALKTMLLSIEDPEEAKELLTELSEAGDIRIGNQPLTSDRENLAGSAMYFDLIGELDDAKLEKQKEEAEQDRYAVNGYVKDYSETTLDYDQDDFEEWVEKEEERITKLDARERMNRDKALRSVTTAYDTRRDTEERELVSFAYRAGTTNLNRLAASGDEKIKITVNELISKGGIPESQQETLKELVYLRQPGELEFFVTDKAIALNTQAETIIGEFQNKFQEEIDNLTELMIETEEESFSYNDKTYDLSDSDNNKFIYHTITGEIKERLIEELGEDIKSLLMEPVNQDQGTLEKDSEDVSPEEVEDKEDKIKEARRNLNASPSKARGASRGRLKVTGNNKFPSIPLLDGATKFFRGSNPHYAEQGIKYFEAFEKGLSVEAYGPAVAEALFKEGLEKAPELIEETAEEYHQLARSKSRRKPTQEEKERREGKRETARRGYFNVKRFNGYTPEGAVNSYKDGFTKDGVGIPDPKKFFDNELIGSNDQFRAYSLIEYENKKELSGLAKVMGVSVDTLHNAQVNARLFYSGKDIISPKEDESIELQGPPAPVMQTVDRVSEPVTEDLTKAPVQQELNLGDQVPPNPARAEILDPMNVNKELPTEEDESIELQGPPVPVKKDQTKTPVQQELKPSDQVPASPTRAEILDPMNVNKELTEAQKKANEQKEIQRFIEEENEANSKPRATREVNGEFNGVSTGFKSINKAKALPLTRDQIPNFKSTPGNRMISFDYNSYSGSKDVRGIEVVIPNDSTKEEEKALKEWAKQTQAFFKSKGHEVPIRREEGLYRKAPRGVKGVMHLEPFFATDGKSADIVKENPEEYAAIIRSTLGKLKGATFIAPHMQKDGGADSAGENERDFYLKYTYPYL